MFAPKTTLVAAIFMLAWSATAHAVAAKRIETVGVPSGFAALADPHEELVDVYFGNHKIGESRVDVWPGFVRFRNVNQILATVPNILDSEELKTVLAGELPSNSERVCREDENAACGSLTPDTVGVIFDEDHFRIDLFINPKWLSVIGSRRDRYLATPQSPLSVTNSTGIALSGSGTTSTRYNVQNRTIVGWHNARIRSDTSFASHQGFVADSLSAEIDTAGVRYTAGVFWAPGLDLIGQRRIVGVGAASQLDTRVDRDSVSGTPLIVFLQQPSRIDLLIDGRLVSSHLYDAGNNAVDTSGLPDGAYSITLRVQGQNGSVRDERRFFTKNPNIAPLGETLFFGYAGWLANTRRGQPIAISHNFFYQAGAARRLSNAFAFDASVIGTQQNAALEVGGWVLARQGRIRLAALASPRGDFGALVQLASTQSGRLSFNFDLRRIWARGGQPLIPLPTYVETFHPGTTDADVLKEGSYTQGAGSVGIRFSRTYVALIGSYRKSAGMRSDYSLGPAFRWDVANARNLQLTVQGNAELSRSTTAAYLGFRLAYSGRRISVQTEGGSRLEPGGRRSSLRAVGSVTGQYSYETASATSVSVAAGIDHQTESTAVHASGLISSRLGSVRSEFRKDINGATPLQYSLSMQTAAALSGDGIVLGGRQVDDSALIVSVAGDGGDAQFEVLVNDQPRGRVGSNKRLPIFLQPYRAYRVRLKPVNAAAVWFDTAARDVTVYPGNVASLRWTVERIRTVFGRAVYSDGSSVADAIATSKRGLGQSDAMGYFQVDVTDDENISFTRGDKSPCVVRLAQPTDHSDYLDLGVVVCR